MKTKPTARVVEGDCREVLADEAPDSYDACVCDPPYELGFMSKAWDQRGVAFDPKTWRAVLRILKPGAHLVAFGGTRTHHRLMCAIEDAGFEVRDCVMLLWVYGSGFPKSHNVSKFIDKVKGAKREKTRVPANRVRNPKSIQGGHGIEGGDRPWMRKAIERGYHELDGDEPATPEAAAWQGWGTALKPAWEPIILARKPLSEGSVAANVLRWGTGAINVGACKVGILGGGTHYTNRDEKGNCKGHKKGSSYETHHGPETSGGRWPANLVLSHDTRCVLVGTETERGVQRAAGSPGFGAKRDDGYQEGGGRVYAEGGEREVWACVPGCPARMLDEQSGESISGSRNAGARKGLGYHGAKGDGGPAIVGSTSGASRFFYTAKSSSAERILGCPPGFANRHPTVKPLALMRWLVRLVTPPGGVVLDPFAGSGSTLVAAMLEGHDSVGIDSDPESVACARGRIAAAEEWGESFTGLKKVRVKRRRFLRAKKP